MTTLFAIVATFFGTTLVMFPLGWMVGIKTTVKAEIGKIIRENGLGNMETVKLYGRAVKIVRRLHGLTELAADILSPQSKRLVDQWVRDYRKALDEGKARAAADTDG